MSAMCILLFVLFVCVVICMWKYCAADDPEQFINGNKVIYQRTGVSQQELNKLDQVGLSRLKSEFLRLREVERRCVIPPKHDTMPLNISDKNPSVAGKIPIMNIQQINWNQQQNAQENAKQVHNLGKMHVQNIRDSIKTANQQRQQDINKVDWMGYQQPPVRNVQPVIQPPAQPESIVEFKQLNDQQKKMASEEYNNKNNGQVHDLQAYVQCNYDVYRPIGAGIFGFVLKSNDGMRAIKLLNNPKHVGEFDRHKKIYDAWKRLGVKSFIVPQPFKTQRQTMYPLRAHRMRNWMDIGAFYEMELLPPLVTIKVNNKEYNTLIQPSGGFCSLYGKNSSCVISTGQKEGLDEQPPKGIFCYNTEEMSAKLGMSLSQILGQIFQVHLLARVAPYDTEFVITKQNGKPLAANIDFGLCEDANLAGDNQLTKMTYNEILNMANHMRTNQQKYQSVTQLKNRIAQSIYESRYIMRCNPQEIATTINAITTPLPGATENDKKYLQLVKYLVIPIVQQHTVQRRYGNNPVEINKPSVDFNTINFNTLDPQVLTIKL